MKDAPGVVRLVVVIHSRTLVPTREDSSSAPEAVSVVLFRPELGEVSADLFVDLLEPDSVIHMLDVRELSQGREGQQRVGARCRRGRYLVAHDEEQPLVRVAGLQEGKIG